MKLLKNVSRLERELLDLLTTINFNRGPEVYLQIESINCVYDNYEYGDSGDLDGIEIHVNWGRYFNEDNPKHDLNEDHHDKLYVNIDFIDNYDYIKGMFAQIIMNNYN